MTAPQSPEAEDEFAALAEAGRQAGAQTDAYLAWARRKRAELAAELSAMLPEGMRFEWK